MALLKWYSLGTVLVGLGLLVYTYCTLTLNTGLASLPFGLLIIAYFCFMAGLAKLYAHVGEGIS